MFKIDINPGAARSVDSGESEIGTKIKRSRTQDKLFE